MAVRGCPSRDQMLKAGTARPEQGSTLKFACVCWQPWGVTPIIKEGDGPAGPGCVSVRAEVAPGAFVFFENVPAWGERRHEINRSDSPMLAGLNHEINRSGNPAYHGNAERALVRGSSTSLRGIATDAESDGWMETSVGSFQLRTDDCKALSPEQANVTERTVIRWVEEP